MWSVADRRPISVVLAALTIVGAACSSGNAELPDADGTAIWGFLQEVDYQDQWELWPGKGELYDGGEPHGALFTTYLNPAAFEALTQEPRQPNPR